MQRLSCCVDEGDKSQFRLHPCQDLLKEHFSQSLEDIGIVSHVCATLASGALLARVLEVQKSDCSHINTLQFYTSGRFMELDITARRNLELTETLRGKEKKGSLLWVLDKTGCPMGSRMLRSWMEKPLLDPIEIDRRLSAVEELLSDPMGRGAVVEVIKTISDLERVMARIVTGSAGGRDLVSLAQGCRGLPQLKAGQKPTPMWAAIMLRTVSGLSLSKAMRGLKPASAQKRSLTRRAAVMVFCSTKGWGARPMDNFSSSATPLSPLPAFMAALA